METEKLIKVCDSANYLGLEQLESWDENPRQISEEAAQRLDESILSLGLFKTFLVWRSPVKEKWQVIGGNQRLLRMESFKEDGYSFESQDGKEKDMLPVTILSAKEAKIKLIALRDNNADGEWKYEELSHYLKDLDELIIETDDSLSIALAGFDNEFLDDLIEYANDPEIKVMTAASIDPDDDVTEFGEGDFGGEDEVGEEPEEQKIVSIVLGHVRGRLRYETYQLLLEVLSSCIEEELDEEEGGLDIAFKTMLDNYKLNVKEEL
jgi:hypothetical protein